MVKSVKILFLEEDFVYEESYLTDLKDGNIENELLSILKILKKNNELNLRDYVLASNNLKLKTKLSKVGLKDDLATEEDKKFLNLTILADYLENEEDLISDILKKPEKEKALKDYFKKERLKISNLSLNKLPQIVTYHISKKDNKSIYNNGALDLSYLYQTHPELKNTRLIIVNNRRSDLNLLNYEFFKFNSEFETELASVFKTKEIISIKN